MRLSRAWIIARNDLKIIRKTKYVLYMLVIFPIFVAVGFPLILHFIVRAGGAMGAGGAAGIASAMGAFSIWFIIGTATIPTAIASYSIVGEKSQKSLEPLLATPTTDGEILLGKSLAAFIPTMVAIYIGVVIFMVLMDLVTKGLFGYLYYPNPAFTVEILALVPLVAITAIEGSVIVSERATDVRTAQQGASVMFLPFIALYVVSIIGEFPLNTRNLSIISGIMLVIAAALFFVSKAAFKREEILTKWK